MKRPKDTEGFVSYLQVAAGDQVPQTSGRAKVTRVQGHRRWAGRRRVTWAAAGVGVGSRPGIARDQPKRREETK